MFTIRRRSFVLLMNYALLALFGTQGLLETPAFSDAWWLMVGLLLVLAVQNILWPVGRTATYLYLAVLFATLAVLSILNQEFLYLGFVLSGYSAAQLPWRQARLVIAAYALVGEIILIRADGWREALYPGIAFIIGFFALGYAYSMTEQAEQDRDETQRLLDELRETHTRLEAYAAQAQELAALEERNRIARELHDSVKQQAFAVAGQLAAARAMLERDPTAAGAHLRQAEGLLDEVRAELSQLIHELRPVALQDKGLAQALREWGAVWSQQSGMALQVSVQDERRLPLEAEQAFFRIAQEALSNVARHSRATRAEILLEFSYSVVTMQVRDNGLGFDPAQTRPGEGGVGLRSMRERAERLENGQFTITSAPGQGTCIVVKTQNGAL